MPDGSGPIYLAANKQGLPLSMCLRPRSMTNDSFVHHDDLCSGGVIPAFALYRGTCSAVRPLYPRSDARLCLALAFLHPVSIIHTARARLVVLHLHIRILHLHMSTHQLAQLILTILNHLPLPRQVFLLDLRTSQ